MIKKIICLILSALLLTSFSAALASCEEDNGKENDMYLLLINKKNAVGADFVPEWLFDVNASYTTGGKYIQLEETVARAAVKMLDDMRADGIENVTITSGYRTYDYQKTLFDRYCNNEAAAHPTWSDEQIRTQVLTYSAAPGTSEHQSGLCMDLFVEGEMEGLWNYGSETPKNPYDKGFAETDAYEWLCRNAHKYGFILRFPENKTAITGYAYESWHYRYVGEVAAGEIHERNITLEEYLDK